MLSPGTWNSESHGRAGTLQLRPSLLGSGVLAGSWVESGAAGTGTGVLAGLHAYGRNGC